MTEHIAIDEKYTYVFDEGKVVLLRYGQPWVVDPTGAKAWIAAACQIEELRAKVGRTLPDPKGPCVCSFESEDRGGGHSELVQEYEPACPVHSTHVYDPRTGVWVESVAPTRNELAKAIWEASRADEGTISATGANIVAERVLLLLAGASAPTIPTTDQAVEAIQKRLSWASIHWGTQGLHPDALPHIADAVLALVRGEDG